VIRKPKTTAFWVERLPHWKVEDGRYFITIHLAGAIPTEGCVRIKSLADEVRKITDRDSPEWLSLQRAIYREMEEWLDRAEWNAKLRNHDVAAMVVEAIEHREKRGDWRLYEYVVMPTHLHLFCEIGSRGMKSTLEDFKRWTGHQAGKILGVRGERFWQREWFDHWSRSDEQDERIAQYIRENPVKAQLVAMYSDWPYGSWRRPRPPGRGVK
jgi:REP element-mobilizing transposase RayT